MVETRIRPIRADIASMKVISHAYRFVWVGIPKAATRSLYQLFIEKPTLDYQAEETKLPVEVLLATRPELQAYFRYGFVRNPWARVVSCWLNKFANPGREEIEGVIAKYPGLYPQMPFAVFARWLLDSPYGRDEGANRHWQSQHRFIMDRHGRILLHWLGRMEEIEAGFREVCEKLGLPHLELPRRNRSPEIAAESTTAYRGFYSVETRDLVRRRYARDLELFGYEW